MTPPAPTAAKHLRDAFDFADEFGDALLAGLRTKPKHIFMTRKAQSCSSGSARFPNIIRREPSSRSSMRMLAILPR